MTWLAIVLAFELGLMPGADYVGWDKQGTTYTEIEAQIFTRFEVETIILKTLYIGGSVQMMMDAEADGDFNPLRLWYGLEAGLRFGPADIFYRHYCSHPQTTYAYSYIPEVQFEGSYDELGVRLELEWQGGK